MEKRLKRKQLAVFVEDSPGVLTHVSGLISWCGNRKWVLLSGGEGA